MGDNIQLSNTNRTDLTGVKNIIYHFGVEKYENKSNSVEDQSHMNKKNPNLKLNVLTL